MRLQFRATLKKNGQPFVIEQQLCGDVEDGRFATLDLLCTGFRPTAAATPQGATHVFDAGDLVEEGLPALPKLLEEFRENGGKIWLCGACTKPRGITDEHTVPGATIVGAATIVEAIANGATPIAFA